MQSLTNTIQFYREGSREGLGGSRSHLRATGQGIEEVKEYKAGEGHCRGARGARLVFGDLEHKCMGGGDAAPSPRAQGRREHL